MTVSTHWYLLDELTTARRAALEAEKAQYSLASALPQPQRIRSIPLDGLAAAAVALLFAAAELRLG